MIFFPGDHFFRFHPFWSKGEYFTNGWFPIKAHWGIPLFITWNVSVPSIPLITRPAMALCCRLSNFFFAESLSFSQVFSSRTKYLEANFHPKRDTSRIEGFTWEFLGFGGAYFWNYLLGKSLVVCFTRQNGLNLCLNFKRVEGSWEMNVVRISSKENNWITMLHVVHSV